MTGSPPPALIFPIAPGLTSPPALKKKSDPSNRMSTGAKPREVSTGPGRPPARNRTSAPKTQPSSSGPHVNTGGPPSAGSNESAPDGEACPPVTQQTSSPQAIGWLAFV